MTYVVTRQVYWPDGTRMVEVVRNGWDSVGPDMLTPKFPGEGEEYQDPREAVAAAIEIRDGWTTALLAVENELPQEQIPEVGFASTWGGSLQLEGQDPGEVIARANEEYEHLPKCDWCGSLLPEHPWRSCDDPDLGDFCREYCVDEAIAESDRLNADPDTDEGE